jgi:serine/threonine protein kinase
MKKTFESFAPCLELREVIFLRQLPVHAHLVPALDIFLDPHTKKLHIAMEYMDGNLYQLMKAREGKLLEGHAVKSILLVEFDSSVSYTCSDFKFLAFKYSLDWSTFMLMGFSIAILNQRTS